MTVHWISEFNEKENFDPESSYVETTSSIISYGFDELYKGYQDRKKDISFIIHQLYYHCLSTYFSAIINDIIGGSIEEHIISKISQNVFVPVLQFTLDEKFAVDVDDIVKGSFRTINRHEVPVLKKFRDFSKSAELILTYSNRH